MAQAFWETVNPSIRETPMTLYLDEPGTATIAQDRFCFRGWIACEKGKMHGIAFQTTHGPLRLSLTARPDVKSAYPQLEVAGFSANVDVRSYLPAVDRGTLTVFAVRGLKIYGRFRFNIAPDVISRAIQTVAEY